MHIAIALWSVLASWRSWNWNNFHEFHTTILYMSLTNLFYLFLTVGYPLWIIQPDAGLPLSLTNSLYTFIIFPCTVILYLSRYPKSAKWQIFHNIKWIIIYIGVEWIGSIFDRISYDHEWNLAWSFLFVIVMFPMLRLHYKKPIMAYLLSIVIIIVILYYFQVPWNVPIDDQLSTRSAMPL